MEPTVKFSLVLPVLVLLLSASIFIVPAVHGYRSCVRAQQPGSAYIAIGQIALPQQRLPQIVFRMTARNVYGPVSGLNAPAIFPDALISIVGGRSGNWFVHKFGLEVWRVISYPFFALPAWWFVGRGFDGLAKHARMRRSDLVVSLAFTVLAAALAAGLRFGLADSERQAQDSLNWFISGLALWGILFAVPAAAWIRNHAGPSTCAE